jgi:hypothetical protein
MSHSFKEEGSLFKLYNTLNISKCFVIRYGKSKFIHLHTVKA